MRMRKKKWVDPFLQEENEYLIKDLNSFEIDKPIYMEIGMGMGDFICASAKLHPEIFYIGLERDQTCVARAIKKARELELNNLRIILVDANNLQEIVKEKSLAGIYLHFSDPWPKKRQHKRRLTYLPFLKKYEKILKDDGFLIFKTDNEAFFDDSLQYFKESNFELVEINRNYFLQGEPMTAYQERFVNLGMPIYFGKFSLKK